MPYSEPKITIDLEEYNNLLFLKKQIEEESLKKAMELFVLRTLMNGRGHMDFNSPEIKMINTLKEVLMENGLMIKPVDNAYQIVKYEPR